MKCKNAKTQEVVKGLKKQPKNLSAKPKAKKIKREV